jgi:hypothetical protein
MKRLLVILITTLGFGQINWDIEIVDSIHTFDGGIGYASLKLDSLTSPQIAYYQVIETYNDTGWAKVIYAHRIEDQWVKETVDSSFGDIWTNYYKYPSLYLDRYDNPHIAYIHRKEDNTYHLHYANKLSGNWVDTILTSSAYATIAVDTNDYPCIACTYKDPADTVWYTKYIYWDGVSWDFSIVDDGNNLSDVGPSLAIDGKNNPHIAYYQAPSPYYDYDSVKYVYWDGANWVFAWAESIGMGSEHGSLALCLDCFDYPHIAYCKWPPLWYAHWDGSIWHNEGPIDAASWEIRLDLDSLGLPHIAYIDQMGQRPEYCYRDSITWHLCGFIEPDPYVFSYRSVSLCLDNNCEPHVAYVGSISNYNKMKYAKGTFVGINEDARYRIQDTRFRLEVYPNPAQEIVNIEYALSVPGKIELSIYDISGSRVKLTKRENLLPGYYQEKIDTRNLPSGVYFIVLKQDNEKVSKKFLVVK